MICVRGFILFISLLICRCCDAQQDTTLLGGKQFPEKYITEISSKIARVDRNLSKKTLKTLRKFGKLEADLTKKLAKNDSTKNSFLYSREKLEQLKNEFTSIPPNTIGRLNGEYNAYLDTLRTALKFIGKQAPTLLTKSKQVTDKLAGATSKLNTLENKLLKADEIKKYFREKREFIEQQLKRTGMIRQLKRLEKTSYYYADYVKEYKSMLKDKKKAEKKAMALLYSVPAFKKFVSENSSLASLFKLPTVENNVQLPSLAGIQTRTSVQQVMQDRISTGGPNAAQAVRQQILAAQAELGKLKDQISKYGSADAEIPRFRPNNQKTKTFLQRLEYGMNMQFGKTNNLLPATSDIALSLGYKLNTNGSFGVGASYKIGLGTGWNNIKFSNQGIGLRSYIDWKLKGKFYISGGYEETYNSGFKSIQQLKNYPAWQSSGLVGISKKMKIRAGRNVKFQVLYDFFCYRHVPVTQPFVFRTGFLIK